MKDGFVK